jgi:predicted nucleic acid-binding protein
MRLAAAVKWYEMHLISQAKAAVAERWVLNASPLIVPRAVAEEIQAGPTEDRATQALAAGRFTIVNSPSPLAEILAWDLGSGEAAVLSFALAEQGWTVIVDDAAARKCAQSFSIPVKGTLGVVILARQRGLIPSTTEVLLSLQTAGFYLDDQIVREALARTVGEKWPP